MLIATDAAGYVYNAREFEAFTQPGDYRPKRWLLLDREVVERLER